MDNDNSIFSATNLLLMARLDVSRLMILRNRYTFLSF